MIAVTVLLSVALFVPNFVWRGIKSWWAGVTSGLLLVSFATGFLSLILHSAAFGRAMLDVLAVVVISFLIGFLLNIRARIHAERRVDENNLKVPQSIRSLAGTQPSESDDPIQTWEEDALGRAALVDSITVKALIAKSPVLILSGDFGSGKTSILNLLREHLGDKTITVSFSTWLPGSQETLASYLLNDIANECQRQFVVPGLRRSARRLAIALGQSVPLLKNYLNPLPAPTQKEDIQSLKAALERLPKRVVVLLDEVDRMDKEELVTLLKVIRGISTLPNLSFICAGDRKAIVETVKGTDNEKNSSYFEKFFPVLIQIPNPDPAALRKAGTKRLTSAFERREWFESKSEAEKFHEQIDELWDPRIAPFCRNLRAIGLLANDVSVAAAPVRREVDPLDLTLVELLRRFKPRVYEIVARNSAVLTGGESLVRGGTYQSDRMKKESEKQLLMDLQEAEPDAADLRRVKGILYELFPLFGEIDGRSQRPLSKRKDSDEGSEKRISEAGIFPAYFRYELPEAIFSSVEIGLLVEQIERAPNQAAREAAFVAALDSMERNSLKRDDFLRKLADAAMPSIPLPVARELAVTAAKAADKYSYDIMPGFGEAGHVLRAILRVAKRLPQSDRASFLAECIRLSSHDALAFRILTVLTQQKNDDDLNVSVSELYSSFIERMRKRYGPDSDISTIDLGTSDPWAFDYWGRLFNAKGVVSDPDDRRIQYEFWLRYIGNSKRRLAQAFRNFFLPVAVYGEDPTPLVENKISMADLKRLYEELADDGSLTDWDYESLRTIKRFLDGEFKGGVGPVGGKLYA